MNDRFISTFATGQSLRSRRIRSRPFGSVLPSTYMKITSALFSEYVDVVVARSSSLRMSKMRFPRTLYAIIWRNVAQEEKFDDRSIFSLDSVLKNIFEINVVLIRKSIRPMAKRCDTKRWSMNNFLFRIFRRCNELWSPLFHRFDREQSHRQRYVWAMGRTEM